jgi:hypothetical protein
MGTIKNCQLNIIILINITELYKTHIKIFSIEGELSACFNVS